MCEIEETFTVSGNSEKMRYSVSLCRILSIVKEEPQSPVSTN